MESVKEKLASLVSEANLCHLDDYVDFFSKASSKEEYMQAIRCCKTKYQGDFNQMVGSKFEILYSKDEWVRIKVHERLSGYSLPDELIDEYFSKEAHVSCGFPVRFGPIGKSLPKEQIDTFIADSSQIMLDCIREYLGLA
jgi:hypothetical protein